MMALSPCKPAVCITTTERIIHERNGQPATLLLHDADLDVGASHVFQILNNGFWLSINRDLGQPCQVPTSVVSIVKTGMQQATQRASISQVRSETAHRTGHVNQRQVGYTGRVDCQLDRLGRHRLPDFAQMPNGLCLNFVPDGICASHVASMI